MDISSYWNEVFNAPIMIQVWSNIPERGSMITSRGALGGLVMEKKYCAWRFHWVFVENVYTEDITIR